VELDSIFGIDHFSYSLKVVEIILFFKKYLGANLAIHIEKYIKIWILSIK